MKIATYNVNGINGRLPVLLRWLKEEQPDIVWPARAEGAGREVPGSTHPRPRLRCDLARAEELEWCRHPQPRRPRSTRPGAGCRATPDPSQSRYLEAAINGVLIAGFYLPNGNPRPGPKLDYKMAWFGRLIEHAAQLFATDAPVVLAGDYNVMPTKADVYKPERWTDDALFAPEVRAAFVRLIDQGWTDALRKLHPDETIYTFWDYFRNAFARNAGLRLDHLLLNVPAADRLKAAGVDRDVRGWEKSSDPRPDLDRARNQARAKAKGDLMDTVTLRAMAEIARRREAPAKSSVLRERLQDKRNDLKRLGQHALDQPVHDLKATADEFGANLNPFGDGL